MLLPSSLYPTTTRDYLLAVTGGAIYGVFDLGPVGHLNYSGYGGAIYIDLDHPGHPARRAVHHGRPIALGHAVPGLSLAGSVLAAEFDGTVHVIRSRNRTASRSTSRPSSGSRRSSTCGAGRCRRRVSSPALDAPFGRSELLTRTPNRRSERYYVLATVETTRRGSCGYVLLGVLSRRTCGTT